MHVLVLKLVAANSNYRLSKIALKIQNQRKDYVCIVDLSMLLTTRYGAPLTSLSQGMTQSL